MKKYLHRTLHKTVKRKRSFVHGVNQIIDRLCEKEEKERVEKRKEVYSALLFKPLLEESPPDPKTKAYGEFIRSRAKTLKELFDKIRRENEQTFNESTQQQQQQSDRQSTASSSLSLSAEEEEKLCERLSQGTRISAGCDRRFDAEFKICRKCLQNKSVVNGIGFELIDDLVRDSSYWESFTVLIPIKALKCNGIIEEYLSTQKKSSLYLQRQQQEQRGPRFARRNEKYLVKKKEREKKKSKTSIATRIELFGRSSDTKKKGRSEARLVEALIKLLKTRVINGPVSISTLDPYTRRLCYQLRPSHAYTARHRCQFFLSFSCNFIVLQSANHRVVRTVSTTPTRVQQRRRLCVAEWSKALVLGTSPKGQLKSFRFSTVEYTGTYNIALRHTRLRILRPRCTPTPSSSSGGQLLCSVRVQCTLMPFSVLRALANHAAYMPRRYWSSSSSSSSSINVAPAQCNDTNLEPDQDSSYPSYLVAFSYKGHLIGAGVIVEERHVLTSASLIFFQLELNGWGESLLPPLMVHAGSRSWDVPAQVREVIMWMPGKWQGYARNDTDSGRIYMTSVKDDLIVVQLDRGFEFNDRVGPIRTIEARDPSPMGKLATVATWDSNDGRVSPGRSRPRRNSSSGMHVYPGLRLRQASSCETCMLDRYGVSLSGAKDGWCVAKCAAADGRRYLNGSPVLVNGTLVGIVAGPMGDCSLESSYVVDLRPHLEDIDEFIELNRQMAAEDEECKEETVLREESIL
ncbi:unnamed protein product [Trichogramma brassicae]|uniref:Peptidase S1 domain-containing protein n=1 Tax=Trichogramma brassicae TaxID=86971 RepID=A0A6H5I6S9_9HYME|nr:unnamed protein product [Trichogramma brassicae]